MNTATDVSPVSTPLTDAQWQLAMARSRTHAVTLVEAVESLFALDAATSLDTTAARLHLRAFSPALLAAHTPRFDLLPWAEAREANGVLLDTDDNSSNLLLVLANPFNDLLVAQLERRFPQGFRIALAHPRDLGVYLQSLESSQRALRIDMSAASPDGDASRRLDISLASIGNDSNEVVRLVNATLFDALKFGASDIHLENSEQALAIKYRLDGVLMPQSRIASTRIAEQVISRLKVLAELDVAERRVPQDGRFSATVGGREIDFRVSIMPGLFGEDAVLRVLDRQALLKEFRELRLDALGFSDETRARIRRLARLPHGMLLVTGPTGSGKTTTLYATLNEIHHGDDKIITIEDPVEYQLPGVLQIPVNEKKGLTFARGLRSILRHDPDKIMVGEIRDPETAAIAVQAALTGHLVFTTVHANNVFDVLGRFRHMAVDNYSLVAALNGVVAQRLVRIICEHCREAHAPLPEELAEAGLSAQQAGAMQFMRGRGCTHCHGTGYKGRRAIAEVLVLNDELKGMLLREAPLGELKEAARRAGMQTIQQEAMAGITAGQTTLAEIRRVTATGAIA